MKVALFREHQRTTQNLDTDFHRVKKKKKKKKKRKREFYVMDRSSRDNATQFQ